MVIVTELKVRGWKKSGYGMLCPTESNARSICASDNTVSHFIHSARDTPVRTRKVPDNTLHALPI